MPNNYTKILPSNQSKQIQLKINTSEVGILSFIRINEQKYGQIKQNMKDHSPFMQECIRAKAGVKNSHVEQCANKETGNCTD